MRTALPPFTLAAIAGALLCGGCFQLIDNPTFTLSFVSTFGQPQVLQPFGIPNSPVHLGVSAFFQTLVTDASPANPRGFAISNAVQVTVGAL